MSSQAIAEPTGSTGGIWDDPGVMRLATTATLGWRVLKLKDVCTRITDGTHKTPRYQPEGVRFISIRNIRPFQPINWETYERYITEEEHRQLTKRCKPEIDDIIFPRIGTLGFAKRIDFTEEVSIFVGLGLLKPDKNLVQPKFLEYWMNHPLIARLSRERASGSGRLTLPLEQSREFPVLVPPMQDQSRIVADVEKQFSRLDEVDIALRHTQTKIDRYCASVLATACNGSMVGRDVRSWPQSSLGELAIMVQYGSSAKTSELGTGIPVLRMGNIADGTLVLDKLKYLPKDHDEFPSLLLEPGDLLFNRTNSPELVGKSAVYQGKPVPCSFASYLIRLRFKAQILPEFVACYLNSSLGRSWVRRVVTQQVGQANVNGSKLKALVIAVPPIGLQRKIVAEVERSLSVAREVGRQISANLVRADRMRQAVIAEAFSRKEYRETIRVRRGAKYA